MNPKSKKVLAGAAVAGVLVTWIPQLVSAGDDAPPPTRLGPAVVEDARSAGAAAGSGDLSPSGPVVAVEGESVQDDSDPARTLERRLDAVRAFLPERSQRDLDVLAAAWSLEIEGGADGAAARSANARTEGGESVSASPADEPAERSQEKKAEIPAPVDPLDAFVAANPLTGVLYSDDMRLANLGANVVREGDDLFGIAHVESIGPRWVVLARGGRQVRVDLAPLTARPRIDVAGGSAGAPATGSAIAPTAPGAPSAPTAPVPGATDTAAAAQDLANLLSGLQATLGAAAGTGDAPAKTNTKAKGTKP